MTTQAYEAGRLAFVPGWTNHVEHNPYAKGSQDYVDFANGWNSRADISEYGLEVE